MQCLTLTFAFDLSLICILNHFFDFSVLTCPHLQVPAFVKNSLFPVNSNVGTSIKYECRLGFYIRPTVTSITITCNKDGKWVPDLQENQCKRM